MMQNVPEMVPERGPKSIEMGLLTCRMSKTSGKKEVKKKGVKRERNVAKAGSMTTRTGGGEFHRTLRGVLHGKPP